MKILSYGGGLDSFAMLLDGIERGEKPDACVFCDVADGAPERENEDPGEWPSTYRHMREVVIPLCEREGIEFVWLTTEEFPIRGDRSLFAYMERKLQFPGGAKRICSSASKIERFRDWMNSRHPGETVEVWVGFEAGEEGRAARDPHAAPPPKPRPGSAIRINRFPLMERGLCRCRCEALVRRLGYPVPRKSACVFCPYGSKGDFQRLAVDLPDQFARVVEARGRQAAHREERPEALVHGVELQDEVGADAADVHRPTVHEAAAAVPRVRRPRQGHQGRRLRLRRRGTPMNRKPRMLRKRRPPSRWPKGAKFICGTPVPRNMSVMAACAHCETCPRDACRSAFENRMRDGKAWLEKMTADFDASARLLIDHTERKRTP